MKDGRICIDHDQGCYFTPAWRPLVLGSLRRLVGLIADEEANEMRMHKAFEKVKLGC